MSRFKSIIFLAVLTISISSTAFAGTIVGARTSRAGNIAGTRAGNIAGTRTGNIAGTSVGTRPDRGVTRLDLSTLISTTIFRLLLEGSLF
jgi:hypothetical protein